jgi:molybdenum cofactor cytidylyltransferase
VVRGLVLAAGASSRMGRAKAALPLGDAADTFLARLIRTLTSAAVSDIVVVTGATPEVVRAAAGPIDRHVRFVHNPRWQIGQLSSLVSGLEADPVDAPPIDRAVESGLPHLRSLPDALLVTLVDIPLVSPETCRRVLASWRATRAPIVRPARGDVHGHPVVFDRAVFDELRAADPEVGAKAVVRAHAAEVLDVPIDDPGAYLDIDTEEDYRAIVGSGRR